MKNLIQLVILLSSFLLQNSCTTSQVDIEQQLKCIPHSAKSEWCPKLYSHFGIDHVVYQSIENSEKKPPLILLHELPGLSEQTLDYAQTLTEEFSVYVPLLFGEVYQENILYGLVAYLFNSEWHSKENRPIYEWMRQVSSDIADEHPEQKMGVIGMCLTGAMPLALLENKQINSIVMSQPTLPIINLSDANKSTLDLSDLEYSYAKQRTHSGEVKILGLRFQTDGIANREKLKTLQTDFSNALINLEICESEYDNLSDLPNTHSVLISAWKTDKKNDHPLNIRRQQVKQFFRARLLMPGKGEIPTGKSCPELKN